MENDNKAQIIVNSKYFRKYLKEIKKLNDYYLKGYEDTIQFELGNGILTYESKGMDVEHKGSLEFCINTLSVANIIKALKYAPEQLILVKVSETSNNFELQCVY